MRACFRPNQNLRAKTQKISSNARSLGLECFRFRTGVVVEERDFPTDECGEHANAGKCVVTNSQSMRNIGLCYRKDCVDFNEPYY